MKKIISFVLLALAFTACKDDEVSLPDNYANFKSTEQGLTEKEALIEISFNRALDQNSTLQIDFTPSGITYGEHFTTEPQATNNSLQLVVPAGSSSVQFKVLPKENILLTGNETLNFTIKSISTPNLIGAQKDLKLSFSKIISQGARLTLEGKTSESNYFNNVYADLSANTTKLSARKSWNLAFTNSSEFRVILNPAYQTTAAATTKSDINLVSLADTSTTPDIYLSMALIGAPETMALVDDWNGDLNKTVFAQVSENSANNKVYLVAFEGKNNPKSAWYKVKVDRSSNGYKVQYAPINSTEIKTVEIAKNQNFNLSFLSFETGLTSAEPEKVNWDIQYGYSTSNSGLPVPAPYWFQDFVTINYLAGVEAAEVLTSTVSYENYTETHINTSTFLKTRDAIGSKWRNTSGAAVGIKTDRFYVIKDPEGNIYKLKFVNAGLNNDGGERGKPVIEFKLVKKV